MSWLANSFTDDAFVGSFVAVGSVLLLFLRVEVIRGRGIVVGFYIVPRINRRGEIIVMFVEHNRLRCSTGPQMVELPSVRPGGFMSVQPRVHIGPRHQPCDVARDDSGFSARRTRTSVDRSPGRGWRQGRAADRARPPLSWVQGNGEGGNEDNFTPLTSLEWQLHVYGDATPEIRELCKRRTLGLHVFPWRPAMDRTPLRRDVVYLVRPDGYVALVNAEGSVTVVNSYLQRHNVTPLR